MSYDGEEQISPADLQRTLAEAEKDMEERSGIGSASSEDRDNVEPGMRVHQAAEAAMLSRSQTLESMEEIERQSNASSVSSEGTLNSVRARFRGRAGERLGQADASGLDVASSSGGTRDVLPADPMFQDQSAMAARLGMLSEGGASSSSSKPSAVGARLGTLASSTSDSNKGTGSGSVTGSGSGVQSITGTGVGSGTSSGTGTGVQSRSSKAFAVYETLNIAQKDMVDDIIKDLTAKHGNEVATVQMLLMDAASNQDLPPHGLHPSAVLSAASRPTTSVLAQENLELESRVAALKGRLAVQENLQERLILEKQLKAKKEEEKDNLEDKIAGLEARSKVRQDRFWSELSEQKEAAAWKEEELSKWEAESKSELKEQVLEMRKEAICAKRKATTTEAEVAVVKRSEASTIQAQETRIAALKTLLEAAHEDIARSEDTMAVVHGVKEANVLETMQKARNLEDLLGEETESKRVLNQEMVQLRLEMLRLKQEVVPQAQDTMGTSPFLSREREKSGKLQGKARGSRLMKPLQKASSSKQTSKLPGHLSSIDEEEDDETLSQAISCCSGQVSSDGAAGGIGDLHDFDSDEDEESKEKEAKALKVSKWNAEKKIDKLLAEMREKETENKQLKDEIATMDAQNNSKVNRLLEKVENVREERDITEVELAAVKARKEALQMEKEAQIANIQRKLDVAKDDTRVVEAKLWQKVEEKENERTADLEEMRQQLFYAMEAKRLESVRVEDMKRELAASEERHARVVRELNAKLKLAHSSKGEVNITGEEGDSELEQDLLEQLRQVEQERNLLRNEKESLKVYWQGLLEHEQLQHAADLQRLEKVEELLQKERDAKKRLEESFNESERQLEDAIRCKDKAEACLRSEIAAAAEKQIAEERAQSIFGILRCPTRSASSTAPARRPESEEPMPSLQLAMWQLLSAMQGVTAMLCNIDGLRVLDATKKACTLWGSAVLRGSSLSSLVFDDLTASWLRREMTVPAVCDRSTGGFTLRSIGCVEFRNKLGSAFDSSVICARLPSEAQTAKEPVVIVVVEPMEEEEPQGGRPHHRKPSSVSSSHQWPQRGCFRPGPPSGVPSIASEDITANDSVSNIQ